MRVVVLAGDGIGPEVMTEARRVLVALLPDAELHEMPFASDAIRRFGDPLPEETLAACRAADAVLKAPVGDPEFDAKEIRPELGVLRLRSALDVYANLRPARSTGSGRQVDLLIVRELVGGVYFGAKGVAADGTVYDTCSYHPRDVERVARRAFELARARRRKLTSVDKANVMETSRLWRRVVGEIAADYPDVELEHMLADNCAMQIVQAPEQFDTLVMDNLFGDILSDEAAAVTGGLGLAGSASLGDDGPGLFEPVHGSAPDIAGKGIANPVGMLRSTVLMLEYGLGRPEEGRLLDVAIDRAIGAAPTADLGGHATTSEFGDAVLATLSGA